MLSVTPLLHEALHFGVGPIQFGLPRITESVVSVEMVSSTRLTRLTRLPDWFLLRLSPEIRLWARLLTANGLRCIAFATRASLFVWTRLAPRDLSFIHAKKICVGIHPSVRESTLRHNASLENFNFRNSAPSIWICGTILYVSLLFG